MSASNIPTIQSHINLPSRVERVNRIDNQINSNNRKINALENQINAQKEVSAAAKELITNNSESIALTKEIISTIKALIGDKKEMIANNEVQISNNNRKIGILEQLKASSDRLISTYQEQRGLLQDSRDLAIEARDLAIEARDAAIKVYQSIDKAYQIAIEARSLNQEGLESTGKIINIIEKMEAIMEKNPAKYRGLSNTEIQKQPEVIEAKTQVTQLANSKVEQYPKKYRAILTDTVKSVVDVTFSEIESAAADIKVDKELFFTLPKRIEAALDKKYESLSVKEFRKLVDANYKSVENFFRIKRLDYLDLALKDIKV